MAGKKASTTTTAAADKKKSQSKKIDDIVHDAITKPATSRYILLSLISYLLSLISYLLSLISYLLSLISYLLSLISPTPSIITYATCPHARFLFIIVICLDVRQGHKLQARFTNKFTLHVESRRSSPRQNHC